MSDVDEDEWMEVYREFEAMVRDYEDPSIGLDQLDARLDELEAGNLGDLNDEGSEASYLLRSCIPEVVKLLMQKTLPSALPRINEFLQRCIRLSVKYLNPKAEVKVKEMAKILPYILDSMQAFYSASEIDFSDHPELRNQANGFYAEMPDIEGFDSGSLFYVANVNLFGELGGFQRLFDSLSSALLPHEIKAERERKAQAAAAASQQQPQQQQEEAYINKFVSRAAFVLRLLEITQHYLQFAFFETAIQTVYAALERRLLGMDEAEVRAVKKTALDHLLALFKSLVKWARPNPTAAAAAQQRAVNPFESSAAVAARLLDGQSISYQLSARIEILTLELARKGLESGLPQQLAAVTDLRIFAVAALKKDDPSTSVSSLLHAASDIAEEKDLEERLSLMWMPSAYLVPWLLENRILDRLLAPDAHIHLFKRANLLMSFLAKYSALQPCHLDLLWEHTTDGKHETVVDAAYSTLQNVVVRGLSSSLCEHALGKILSVPLSRWDTGFCRFLFGFALASLRRERDQQQQQQKGQEAKEEGKSRVAEYDHGIKLLWLAVQEDSSASQPVRDLALTQLGSLLASQLGGRYREKYINLCIQCLQEGRSTGPALTLLRSLLKAFPTVQSGSDPTPLRSDTLSRLQSEVNLLGLVFADIARTKAARESAATETKTTATTKPQLDFLRFLLRYSELRLGIPETDEFWSLCVEKAADATERDSALSWLVSACPFTEGAAPAPAPSPQANEDLADFLGLSEEAAEHLFLRKLPALKMETFTLSAWSCLERYFRFVNGRTGALLNAHSPTEYSLVSTERLQGVNTLWQVALEVRDLRVREASLGFLTQLYLKGEGETGDRLPPMRVFLQTCLGFLKDAFEQAKKHLHQSVAPLVGPPNPAALEKPPLDIERCLTLLERYLAAFGRPSTNATATAAATATTPGPAPGGEIDLSNGAAGAYTITLAWLKGGSWTGKVTGETTVGAIREAVAERMDLPAGAIRIQFAIKELKNDVATLASVNVVAGTKLVLLQRSGQPYEGMIAEYRAKRQQQQQATAPDQSSSPSEPVTPASLLAYDAESFGLLFQLLQLAWRTKDAAGEGVVDITSRVWSLITSLPPNETWLQSIRAITEHAQSAPPGGPAVHPQQGDGKGTVQGGVDWSRLLDASSVFSLLYGLKLVEKELFSVPKQGEHTWASAFVSTGGLQHLLVTFSQYNFHVLPHTDVIGAAVLETAGREALQLLLRLILALLFPALKAGRETLFEIAPAVKAPEGVPHIHVPQVEQCIRAIPLESFAVKLVSVMAQVTKTAGYVFYYFNIPAAVSPVGPADPTAIVPEANQSEPHPLPKLSFNGSVVQQGLTLLTALMLSSDRDVFGAMVQQVDWTDFVTSVLTSWDKSLRLNALSGLYALCAKVAAPIDEQGREIGTSPLNATIGALLHSMPKLFAPDTDYCWRSDDYCRLLALLIQELCQIRPALVSSLSTTFEQLFSHLRAYVSRETHRHGPVDQCLAGLLDIMRTVVIVAPQVKMSPIVLNPNTGLIDYVLNHCLFDVPHESCASGDSNAPPKCKSGPSRQLAFSLLTELSRGCPETYTIITAKLIQHLKSLPPPDSWSYAPAEQMRQGDVAYGGLKNPACVCYMNASFQQLFHIPAFRDGLLSVTLSEPSAQQGEGNGQAATTGPTETDGTKDGGKASPKESQSKEEKKKDDWFAELQRLFAKLAHSQARVVTPVPFCRVYTDFDGNPVNVAEQMDSNEFLSLLFDRIEQKLKGTPQANLINEVFGGVLANEIICDECGNISERPETFHALPLIVKDKKSLDQSLQAFIQGERLTGNNKYNCSVCKKKVDATKRTCIKSSPPHLIVQLKRFGFDYDRMTKFKLNDAIEFPHVLDLAPYTQARLQGKEVKEEENFTYELRGIVVHTGMAEAGHYYSFIRERLPGGAGQWFELNDTSVTPFDPARIPDQCFGGLQYFEYPDPATGQKVGSWLPKTNNAYLLFYDRVERKASSQPAATDLSALRAQTLRSVPLPARLAKEIHAENVALARLAAVFDPVLYKFVREVTQLHPIPLIQDGDWSREPEDAYFVQNPKLLIQFLFKVLFRARDKPKLKEWVDSTVQLLERSVAASVVAVHIFSQEESPLVDVLLTCPEEETRKAAVSIALAAVRSLARIERRLYQSGNESWVVRLVDRLLFCLPSLHQYWRTFSQYFMLLNQIAEMGPAERALFHSRHLVMELAHFLYGKESPFLASLFGIDQSRLTRPKLGSDLYNPDLSHFVALMATLVCGAGTQFEGGPQITARPPTQLPDRVVDLPEDDRKDLQIVIVNKFAYHMLKQNQNPQAVARILAHWCWQNKSFSEEVLNMLVEAVHKLSEKSYPPFWLTFTAIFDIQDCYAADRVEFAMPRLLQTMRANVQYGAAILDAVKFVQRLCASHALVGRWMLRPANRPLWHWFDAFVAEQAARAEQAAAWHQVHHRY